MVTFPIPAGVILLLLPQLASSNTRATLVKMSRKVRFIGPPVTKMFTGKWQIEEWLTQAYYGPHVNRCKRFVSFHVFWTWPKRPGVNSLLTPKGHGRTGENQRKDLTV